MSKAMIPLILIPGHLCGAWLYAPQTAALAGLADCRVAEPGREGSIGAMADRVLAGAPGRVALVGLSMGGMVAMAAMARAPERILGAGLIDTDPYPARSKERDWRRAAMAAARAEGLGAYADGFVARFFAHDPAVEARLGACVRARARATPPALAEAQARALDGREDMIAGITGYPGPVEVIVGAQDRICPPKLHRPIAEACPAAVLTEIPGCGHLATLEAPEAVNARLRHLVERIVAGTP